jgi:hypothetical protein
MRRASRNDVRRSAEVVFLGVAGWTSRPVETFEEGEFRDIPLAREIDV